MPTPFKRDEESSDEDMDEDESDGEYCDWCAAKIKPSDYDLSENGNIFHCMNNDCDKVVCGRRGCSQQLSYYVCCEECEDSAHSSTYEDLRDNFGGIFIRLQTRCVKDLLKRSSRVKTK